MALFTLGVEGSEAQGPLKSSQWAENTLEAVVLNGLQETHGPVMAETSEGCGGVVFEAL